MQNLSRLSLWNSGRILALTRAHSHRNIFLRSSKAVSQTANQITSAPLPSPAVAAPSRRQPSLPFRPSFSILCRPIPSHYGGQKPSSIVSSQARGFFDFLGGSGGSGKDGGKKKGEGRGGKKKDGKSPDKDTKKNEKGREKDNAGQDSSRRSAPSFKIRAAASGNGDNDSTRGQNDAEIPGKVRERDGEEQSEEKYNNEDDAEKGKDRNEETVVDIISDGDEINDGDDGPESKGEDGRISLSLPGIGGEMTLFGGDHGDEGFGGGDSAPRLPTAVVLPVPRRPMFPGIPYTVSVKNKAVVDALLRLRESSQPYVGVFLERRGEGFEGSDEENSLGFDVVTTEEGEGKEGRTGDEEEKEKERMNERDPDDITDPACLYDIGVFASIQQLVATPDSVRDLIKSSFPFSLCRLSVTFLSLPSLLLISSLSLSLSLYLSS